MLLKAIKAKNSRGDLLNLPLEDVSAGFLVRRIEGLDPVKATLVSSSFANLDGEQYHSSRREARNIKMELGLEPDYATSAVKSLRDQLYNFFMPKTRALLIFEMFDRHDNSVLSFNLEIDSRIESFESELFTKDPEVNISFMCFDPDFVDPRPVVFEGMTVDDLSEESFLYEGNTETGVTFILEPDRHISDFTIYHQPPDGTLRAVYFSYQLISQDILEIRSVMGSKHVSLTREGVERSILYAISPQSNWLEFQPGENRIRVHADGTPIPYRIEYTNKYGGL